MTDLYAAEQKAAPASIEAHRSKDGTGMWFYPLTEHAEKQVGCQRGNGVWMETKEAQRYLRHLKQNFWKVLVM